MSGVHSVFGNFVVL